MPYEITCLTCGKSRTLVAPHRGTVCKACSKRGPNVNGVKDWHLDNYGYLRKSVNGKWVKQHRQVMEEHIGRRLKRKEHVHHKNGNRSDNRLENLELLDSYDHHKEHSDNRKRDKYGRYT